MNIFTYVILFIVVFLSLARADSFEREWVEKEKDFKEYERKKADYQKHKLDGLEAWLRKKDQDEAKKRRDLADWLEMKRGGRAPAANLEDEDNRKREAWRARNSEFQRRYVQSVIAREQARQKVMKDFDSKELRRRENKPWR